MRARSVPIGTMFSWVPSTLRLVKDRFGAMAFATLLTFGAICVLALPFVFIMFHSMSGLGAPGVPLAQDLTGFWIAYAVFLLGCMLLMPPLLLGWFRLCAAADRGEPVSGTQVLAPYRDGNAWARAVLFALIGMLVYLAVLALLFLPFRSVITGIMAMEAAQQAAQATGAPLPPPDFALIGKIFLLYAVLFPVMFTVQFIYMVGFAEVALRPTGAVAAFIDATAGVLRNLLKLLLLMLCVSMAAGAVMFAVILVMVVLGVLLSLLSPVLAAAVFGVFYVALLLVMYPLLFAGHYHVWKDMLGGEAPPALPA